jgi:hypothetical protein
MANTTPNGDRNVEHNVSFEEGLCDYAVQKISKRIYIHIYCNIKILLPAENFQFDIFSQRLANLNEGIHGFLQSL